MTPGSHYAVLREGSQCCLSAETYLLIHGVQGVLSRAIDVNEGLPWELQICCQPPVCLRKQCTFQSGMHILMHLLGEQTRKGSLRIRLHV